MIETRDTHPNETTVNVNDMKYFVTLSGYLELVTLNKKPGLPGIETNEHSINRGRHGKYPLTMDVGRPAESTPQRLTNNELSENLLRRKN